MIIIFNYGMTRKNKYFAKMINIPCSLKFHCVILHHIEIINNWIYGDLYCNLSFNRVPKKLRGRKNRNWEIWYLTLVLVVVYDKKPSSHKRAVQQRLLIHTSWCRQFKQLQRHWSEHAVAELGAGAYGGLYHGSHHEDTLYAINMRTVSGA